MSLTGGLSRPWGESLRTWREEIKGWSREEFIDEVTAVAFRTKEPRGYNLDPRLVARWESGKIRRPQGVYRRILAHMGAPLPQTTARSAPVFPSKRLLVAMENGNMSGGNMKRRNVLLGVSFTAAVFAESALVALTARPVADVARDAGGRHIGMADVEILIENVAHLRRMDFRYGSGRMREQAVRLLHHETTRLLRGSYSDTTGRALLTAVAQAARLAGSMAADVGRSALAQRYYSQALNLATNAGNRLFAAVMLSDMSRLTIQNATGKHCARQAVALARAGTMLAGKATPTLAAQLSAIEARGHALCQDTSASRTAVLAAERHYELVRADSEPPWLSFYTEAELVADLGRALRIAATQHPPHSC